MKDTGHDVFISYASDKGDSHSSRDRKAADKVYAALKDEGIRCWAAHQDILPGDDWLAAIIDAVEKSKVLVLIFSSNANSSKWVKDEITMALDEDIKIIPFRIDEVSPEGGLRILKYRCQWLDAFIPPMEGHIAKLVMVVCQHLGKEPKIAEKSKISKQPEIPEEEIPAEIKSIKSKAREIYKNEKGLWEADYGDGIKMVYIPAGDFTMGSDDYDREKPIHNVFLDGYWMGKYEVTVKQFALFVEDEGYITEAERDGGVYTWSDKGWEMKEDAKWKNPGFKQDDNHPVVCVSWNDARVYCKWLSNKKGLLFKLPTEAQWEKAARGTDSRLYPWDNTPPSGEKVNFADKQAWLKFKFDWADKNIDDGYAFTAPVGSYPRGSSPYGLLDMAGNVWEWCNDWYGEYNAEPQKNPQGPESGSVRVLRGGGWGDHARYLRCAVRVGGGPYISYGDAGFRLCQDNK